MRQLSKEKRLELNRESSFVKWYPKIKDLDIPMPKTIIVKVPTSEEEIEAKVEEIGFPLFMKTDMVAGKHHWDDMCYVEDLKYLDHQIELLVDHHCFIDWELAPLPIEALVFREYIELNSYFKAFDGTPIAKERRYFIDDGKVICHHPYWPVDAIRFWKVDEPVNWKDMLMELNEESEDEIDLLTKYAELVASVLKEDWSVDFAQGKDGTWYLIDLARKDISWHPDCKFK